MHVPGYEVFSIRDNDLVQARLRLARVPGVNLHSDHVRPITRSEGSTERSGRATKLQYSGRRPGDKRLHIGPITLIAAPAALSQLSLARIVLAKKHSLEC
jgi:hypothetical protein